ncbi:MAG: uroporphyrinogen decarboxylase family protein [Kiritimatiellales bacterium]
MSYEIGMAALNLQMPPRVPRTEYSADMHWDLVRAVTGISITPHDSAEKQLQASSAFRKAWDYDVVWNILIHCHELDPCRTDMGHAEYASGGTDRRDTVQCPFNDPDEVLAFRPLEAYGPCDVRAVTRRFEADYARQRSLTPDAVTMTGIYITLISGLLEIFGWDMMLMALADPDEFGQVANRYTEWIGGYFEALAASDVPVVMIHDDIVWTSGPFCSPEWYRKYVFPNYKKLFAPILESGKKLIYTSDGDYSLFIDDIAACGVHGFVMEPCTDMKYIAGKYGRTHAFIGNVDTRALLSGPNETIRAEVERCMKIGKNCPGYFMAVGNHIPANTPVEHALYYNQNYMEMSVR